MNPADVQAVLAQHGSPSPGLDGLQRLADWGTAFQKILNCGTGDTAVAILTRQECLTMMHYIHLMGG